MGQFGWYRGYSTIAPIDACIEFLIVLRGEKNGGEQNGLQRHIINAENGF